MKKMFIIIMILAIIFMGMLVYRNILADAKNNISVKEIENIESYISQIYMWKEITTEALPEFDDINKANELWIWEVVKRNLEEYETTKEEIEQKAKEIFGEEFDKKFPKEGNQSFEYDEESGNYLATETNLNEKEDSFLLNNIEKTKEGYKVEIIEYLEDYSDKENVIIENLQSEEIGKTNINQSDTKIQEIVKNNKERFNKKTIYLVENEDRFIVKKVEK